jgi:hypothetical protein
MPNRDHRPIVPRVRATRQGTGGWRFFGFDVDLEVRRSTKRQEAIMQYLLLIYENEQRFTKGHDQMEHKEYGAFGEEFRNAIKGGNALKPTSAATSVRVREGKRLVTDGPFAETKEQLGGYYLVEAKDLDEATAMATKIPGARHGCIEVRPILTFS